MKKILVYSKPNCPYCVSAKELLSSKSLNYTEVVLGEDMLREDFLCIFPQVKTVPLIIIDGVKVGGYNELREWFSAQPEFLTEQR